MGPIIRKITNAGILSEIILGFSLALALAGAGCGGVGGSLTSFAPTPPAPGLSAADVTALVQAAAQAADPNTMVIAVVDRTGNVLGVYRKPSAPTLALGNFSAQLDTSELAVSLARTAAFFSNDQAPLSSRTVRFLSGIHFPPGITNAANAPLYGIENTNRGCALSANFISGKSVPPARSISGASPGLGITTGKADVNDSDPNAVNPGGVPLFRNGTLLGGIGVAGAAPSVAEYAAYAAATSNGFGPAPAAPGVVFINGVALPFVNQTSLPAGTSAGTFTGSFIVGPSASPSAPPDGMLVAPAAGSLGGLSASDVTTIINNAIATANSTRAVIRLPIGSSARMAIAVSDLDGTVIGLFRMADSTVFSVDVAVTKARNMVYFCGGARTAADLTGVPIGTAVTSRTIGFGAQPFFPPGIDGSSPGPFFNLYLQDVANPCTQGFQPAGPNQSGVVFFPGSLPLYRNGVLVGGLGVSGDGVDQDDFVAAGGSAGFEAPAAIRADQIVVQGVRLPYLKFPSNPTN
ncbi:MAG TPA: heme-binding protein [Candidatus Acidoferrales bacterium]|nr:heme-binding protein [Candidatus Acidoferrales bacterium]